MLRYSINKNQANALDDDWYEVRYRSLEGTEAPISLGMIDELQVAVDRFLNGQKAVTMVNGGGTYQRIEFGYWASHSRIFIFVVIILNIVAVIQESIQNGKNMPLINMITSLIRSNCSRVLVSASEYLSRLFSTV